jgi:hypothetical protein
MSLTLDASTQTDWPVYFIKSYKCDPKPGLTIAGAKRAIWTVKRAGWLSALNFQFADDPDRTPFFQERRLWATALHRIAKSSKWIEFCLANNLTGTVAAA